MSLQTSTIVAASPRDAEYERLQKQSDDLLREHQSLAGGDPDSADYRSYVVRLNQHKSELDAYLRAGFSKS